jgi:hypothetical protein
VTPQQAMTLLLERVASADDGVAWFSSHEMNKWQKQSVTLLKSQRLLRRGRESREVECDECEEACLLPVESRENMDGVQLFFVLCQQRSDINMVIVDRSRLRQWRSSVEAICDFVVDDLEINRTVQSGDDEGLYPLGVVRGEKRSQMVALKHGDELSLVVADKAQPLRDLMLFESGKYRLNQVILSQLVDQSTTADERYTPTETKREARKLKTRERNNRWNKAYRKIKQEHPTQTDSWIANQIAKDKHLSEGKSIETIRKQMKKRN